MNKPYLTGDIYFSFSFNLTYIDKMDDGVRKEKTMEWESNCIYSAIIKDVDGNAFIQLIDFNKEGNEDSISFINRQWNDYIPYFEFGKYLVINEAYINKIPIRLDLSSTRLRGMVSANDCYCRFYIDKYQYSYAQENEKCSISYYLSDTSKNLVGDIWGLGFFTGDVEPKKISLHKGLSCAIIMNKKTNLFPIIIEIDSISLLQNEQEFRLLCDIISFYYAIPVECCISVENGKDLVKVTREISHYNVCQKTNKNENLCYLNYGISHSFIDFLTTIYGNRNKLKDKLELLHTTMNDYVRSFGLDERSRFLVLYSVLETYSWKMEKENIDESIAELYDKLKCIFSGMYREFLSRLDEDMKKKIKIKTLWKNAKSCFSYPVKHSIVRLFEKYNIDNLKMNEEIEKAGLPCGEDRTMKTISDLRNQLMHNRNVDNIFKLPMDVINSKMSFAVCIILLYNLGFSNIAFYKDWLLLSILAENPNNVGDK